jgi:hypothetical protein
MTANEYTVYTMLILLADWRSGVWIGSAGQLGKILHWSSRRCQKLLQQLRVKKYITGECRRPTASAYPIKVERYFSVRGASVQTQGVRLCGRGGASVGATSIEVVLEEKNRTARSARGFSPSYAKKPKATELEGIMQIEADGVRKDYLEFVALRDRGKLPRGMNWDKWQKLTPEQRQEVLRAA